MQQKNGGGNYNLEYIDLHVHACVLSQVQLFAAPWTVARQAPLSMGFLRQKYWRGLPFPSSGGLPDPGIELTSPAFPACQEDSLPLYHLGSPSSIIGYSNFN